MSAIVLMFVLSIGTPDGASEWYVIDSDLTREDCETLEANAPRPVTYLGVRVAYHCTMQEGD